jgi:glycosyltransferase involved in cell wall biosynthesis
MNILHLNHHGSLVGGVEGYIAEVTKALQEAGHSSHLVYFSPNDDGELIANTSYAPLAPWPDSPAAAIQAIKQVMAKTRPDIAYVHAVYHPTLVGWLAQHLPTVAYVHGPYPVCPGSGQYLRNRSQVCPHKAGLICLANAQIEHCCWGRNPLIHVRLLQRVHAFIEAYQQVGIILVGSQFMRQLLQRGGIPSAKLSILPPVLIREPLPPPTFSSDSKTILFGGRLVPEKGLRHLIQALANMETDWQLVVTGDGQEHGPCQTLAAQLGVADRVRFTGWVNNSEMVANLQTCACVAVPSLWPEPFSRIGPEAFLHGKPAVAYAVGGIPDWLEDGLTGYLVAPGDVAGLSRSLQSLLDSPALRLEMGQRARQRARSDWSAHAHVERLLSALEEARAST